jgi:serine/threonine protein kinase
MDKVVSIFGPLSTDPKDIRAAKRKYRMLVQTAHPDKGGSKTQFQELQEAYDIWMAHAEGKQAPKAAAASYSIGKYQVGTTPKYSGTISNLFTADSKVLVKVPRKVSSNAFIDQEATALNLLADLPGSQSELYPRLLDQGKQGGLHYNVLSYYTSMLTLHEVQGLYIKGLPGKDYAWIHRRLLGALAGAHSIGLVHGAVLPENILIEPTTHEVKLISWGFSGKPGNKIPATVKSRQAFYPKFDTDLSPEMDVYMAHSVMRSLLTQAADPVQYRFAKGCQAPAAVQRPTVFQLLTEYDELLYRLYGKRTYRPLVLPATKGPN